jgi:DNA-binding response OmpR family regulator
MGELKVLVIDDHPDMRELLAYSLKAQRFEPVGAENGSAALALLEEWLRAGTLPALILLDLDMPHVDGEAFLLQAHELWRTSPSPPPPIIVISARVDVPPSVREHVRRIITKPFHLREILKTIDALLGSSP